MEDEDTFYRLILENQSAVVDELKTVSENQSVMLESLSAIKENQSVMIVNDDFTNSYLKSSNISSMMIVLILGVLIGIGFVSILKGGKK